MTIRCSQGHENPDGATFCDECGEPLPAAAPASAGDEAPTLQANPVPVPLPVTMPPLDDSLAPPPPPPPEAEASQPAPGADEDEAPQAASAPPIEEVEAPAMPAAPVVPPSAPEPAPIVPPSPPQPAPVAALPRLLVAGTTTTFDLAGKANVVLGREDAPSNSFPDVDLTPYGAEEGGVSRLHARLIQSGDTWTIEDLESTNSTFVNHKRIAPKTPTPLNDGDEIRLGRVDLRFKTTV